jgi:hypothetical protein
MTEYQCSKCKKYVNCVRANDSICLDCIFGTPNKPVKEGKLKDGKLVNV